MEYCPRRCSRIAFACLIAFMLIPGIVQAVTGRLIVRLEGKLAGVIPPSLTLNGCETEESVVLGVLALSAGEVRFENLEPGVYRIAVQGASTGSASLDVGIHAGLTTLLSYDLARGVLRIDPLRPDPFGLDETWEAGWLACLPRDGEEEALRAITSPAPPRLASLDGLGLNGSALRDNPSVGGDGMARSVSVPVGLTPAAEATATRRVLSLSDPGYGDGEATTGDRSRSSYQATIARRFPSAPWKPYLFGSMRALDYRDAAPSVFDNGILPHNGLDAVELMTRADLRPANGTRLTALLYGEGTRRRYFLESFRRIPSHAPREDRAEVEGALRLTHDLQPRLRLLGEVSVQRTFAAVGDGRFFDQLRRYGRDLDAQNRTVEWNLYWSDEHVYNYFRRNVEVDLGARAEVWKDAGTSCSSGAGLQVRRGTYRSYENLDPILTLTGTYLAQAIGYDRTGEEHVDSGGGGPAQPLTLTGFVTARRPLYAGEAEAGLRFTSYRTGQAPLKHLSQPLRHEAGIGDVLDLAAKTDRAVVDPRLGYTRPFGSRVRLWLSGGSESRIPPSQALFYSPAFLQIAATNPDVPKTILGNPGLKPERSWVGAAAAGARMGQGLSVRAGAEGRVTQNAIAPRSVSVGEDSLLYYVNEGRRDLIGLFARAMWEPSPRMSARASYDLSRSRTETVEPSLLDAAWLDGDLPMRGADMQEGLPIIFPSSDDGQDRGLYPSLYDQRHRISVALLVRSAKDQTRGADQTFVSDLEAGALLRAASGRPLTWTKVYRAGGLSEETSPVAADRSRNSVRLPWTAQLDLRVAWTMRFLGAEAQGWIDILDVIGTRNVLRAYPATGEGDDDAWLSSREGASEARRNGDAFVKAYRERLQDLLNYDEPRLVRLGIRLGRP